MTDFYYHHRTTDVNYRLCKICSLAPKIFSGPGHYILIQCWFCTFLSPTSLMIGHCGLYSLVFCPFLASHSFKSSFSSFEWFCTVQRSLSSFWTCFGCLSWILLSWARIFEFYSTVDVVGIVGVTSVHQFYLCPVWTIIWPFVSSLKSI